ncbi:ComEC/Rec2-related protein [Emticicia oligotrophica DSM 17448]|uniref:ComEC/Rec2-related protein n=1 Tax=Emticicia oligotrophica (strain DSM 17448 / CIP 109782 / MTCC 6937 / GPTSA100-15) TaxID=929562 RepID=A0ABN4AEJ9_EMTOG|nr:MULTISPECIES: ComEC/Rec2 family competence protein [Emticicia]AFK03145.1 ComEC/Rec2-related protein [Emticicia oligotrophica DSM 17448]
MKFNAFPVVRYLLFFILGITVYLQTDSYAISFPTEIIYYLIGFLMLIFGLSIRFRQPVVRGSALMAIIFLAGWSLTHFKTASNQPNHFINLPQFSHYQATIIGNSETKPKTFKVEAEINAIKVNGQWIKATGKTLLYFNKQASEKPQYGDVFLIKNMPREVEAPKNPEEFDYRKFLQYKGIYTHHFLWGQEYEKIGHQAPSKLLEFSYKANQYADSVFKARIETPNEYGVASAMVAGLRDDIDNDLLDAYSASGAIHVLSVSGMHVGILFLFLGWMLGWIKKRGKFGKQIFTVLVIGILWGYAIFTGLSSTVLRATVMFSFIQIGTAIGRRQNIYNTLAISALLLLCWNPFWLIDVGFQLSYLAIIGIVFLHPYLYQLLSPNNPIIRSLWEGTCVCFAAQLFTFPLSVYYFHQFPTYFLIANPFVAFFSFAVLPAGLALLILAKVPFLGTVFGFILKHSLVFLNKSIFLFEKLPFATLKGFSISFTEVILIYAIILLIVFFFLRLEFKYLRISLALVFVLTCFNISQDYLQSKQKSLTFHFIPKKSGISIIDGKSATFIADTTLLNSEKTHDFHLKNYYDKSGVVNENKLASNQYTNKQGITYLDFEGKKILWLQQKFNGKLQGNADYVLLSNNAIRKLNPSFTNFQTGLIIVDDSNKRYVVENLKHQADSLHLNLISLYDTGAFSINE